MKFLRTWATPLIIGAFLIMGVTGVLMFFHLDSGLNKAVHEWASWAMLAGVAAHLAVNWRPFVIYFKRPLAAGIMGVGALALAVSFIPVEGGNGNPMMAVVQAIGASDVGTVIALSGQDLEAGLARLREAGFTVEAGTPMRALTGGDRGVQGQIIGLLFAG